MKINRSLFIVIALAILTFAAYFFDLGRYLSLDELKKNHIALEEFVATHEISSPVIYMTAYALAAALSLPIGVFMTLLGGFLFSQPFATLYAVTGASCGASIIYLIAKTAIGDLLKEKAGPFLARLSTGFQENAISYMLFLRLVPIFPFWVVNLAPAFLGVAFTTYVWTTFVGIIPATFAFTQAGVALGAILESNEPFSTSALLNNDMKIALAALGIVALIPVFLKKRKGKK